MQLMMWRPDTLPVPDILPQDGYTIRTMRDGEAACWSHSCIGQFGVESESPEFFERKMGYSIPYDRIFYACIDDKPVGTATALINDEGNRPFLHYIAVNPEHRGHKLGEALISAVLKKHLEDNLTGCFLTTDDFRVPAIKTYIKLGYLPVLWSDDARERWEKLGHAVGYSSLPAFDLIREPSYRLVQTDNIVVPG